MRWIATAVLAVCVAGPAAAQRAGSYNMQGVSVTGEAYSGSATLLRTGDETWRVTWVGSSGEPVRGAGIVNNGILSVGFLLSAGVGVASYRIMPDGRLEGRWTLGGSGWIGTETLTPK